MMETTPYVAYGLALRSSFGLPGMVPAEAEGLQPLALKRVSQTQLQTIWSGPDGPPTWRGRLGDGSELMIEYGTRGDLLFTHGDHAWHHLDSSKESLAVVPRRSGLDWQRAMLTKVLSSISVMRGYEALHASAVESPWGIVAVAAPTGTGKTTLALELMRRGWPLVSDDVLPLLSTPDGVIAHPGTPHMNVAEDSPEALAAESLGATLAILAGERWLAVRDAACEPRLVRAICLLERGRGLSLEVELLPASPLPLAPYILGLPASIGRERRRFELYADLVGSVALLRLTCDVSCGPGPVADLIERTLADAPTALTLEGVR
jgi:hypothetical protein